MKEMVVEKWSTLKKYGIAFQTVQKDFADRQAVLEWIIKNQFGRRNLPAYERARLALRLKPVLAERAKERQALGLKSDEGGRTDVAIAKAAGVGHDTIAKVEKIEAKAAPEVKEQLRTGEISINQAYQTVRREEKKQEVQARIEAHAATQTGIVDIRDTSKKYNIIYADPPWQYWESGNKNKALHYTTMAIDDICNLPIKDIADDDCVLFLWVTYPILQAQRNVPAAAVLRTWA